MFKCRDCGCEYNIKPDYCDCGNDTFDEITPVETRPDIRQIFSVIIFVLCLILAIIPWTIKDKTPKPAQTSKSEPIIKEIPPIEKIWDSTPTEIKKPEPPKAPEIKEPEQECLQIIKPEEQPKKIQPAQKQEVKVSEKPKTVQQPKPTQKQEPPKQIKQPQPKPVQKPEIETESQRPQFTPPVIKIDKTPLINYKNELRIALLSKLNIPNIQGEGECAVSFSISQDGKLLNRSFIYKSSNKSVNDEVYLMLMRLPYFKQPPSLYKGETVKLKFYINNGTYEISFI